MLPVFGGGRQGLLIAAAIALLSGAGCVRNLPPAATPAQVVPAAAVAGPPAAGQGRLVVDVVDGPTPVSRINMEARPMDDGHGRTIYRFVRVPHRLCDASPCVVDLQPGNVLVGFPVDGRPSRIEGELVHVAAGTTVYRRVLSQYRDQSGSLYVLGIIGTAVGAASAITGATLLPIGLSHDSNGLTTAGGITLGAGAALVALGIWAIRHDAPTFRPGASIHFDAP